ncbi:MAG: DNA repair protein RadC [Roseivirga sp.]
MQWAEEDRPREKLLSKGKSSLSEAELIAILIGSGSRELSAVDLAKVILSYVDHDLNLLAKLTVSELQTFKGIGEAKAVSIVSALELGRRRKQSTPSKHLYLRKSQEAYEAMIPLLMDQPIEQFWVIMLTRNNKVLQKRCVSQGGFSGTIADPKVIFKRALEDMANGIILVHNHPSGNKKPSSADLRLTKKIVEAGKLLEIPVLDHIIFTDEGFYSFSDEGVL